MTTLTDRMAEIQQLADQGAGYYLRLIENMGGLESAARADLIIDGNHHYVDLRRTPFAGNERLKELARAAIEAQRALYDELLAIAWHGREED